MGRKSVLIAFCLGGYALGFFAWMVKTPVMQFVENLGFSSTTAESLIAGLVGSTVMVLGVLFWSFLSSG